MTTLQIYERVPISNIYYRYACKWGSTYWFFSSTEEYNTTLSFNEHPDLFTNLVSTVAIDTTPKTPEELLSIVHAYLPELLI